MILFFGVLAEGTLNAASSVGAEYFYSLKATNARKKVEQEN